MNHRIETQIPSNCLVRRYLRRQEIGIWLDKHSSNSDDHYYIKELICLLSADSSYTGLMTLAGGIPIKVTEVERNGRRRPIKISV